MGLKRTSVSVLATVQSVAQGVLVLLAVAAVAACIAGFAGWLPFVQLPLSWGGQPVPDAGMWLQVGVTGLLVLLGLFLPANARMARLERSHRNFRIGMDDVARAYRQAHAADRAGLFGLSAEFDQMRERLEHLRKHPDLAALEPEVLQLAAQMSFESRDLARTYSDERVERAKGFLKERHQEAEMMAERIAIAKRTCEELRRWLTDVEAEERQVQVQMKRLEADLREVLPILGYDFEELATPNVVALAKPQK